MSCDCVEFEDCYLTKDKLELGYLIINFINLENLKINKKALGRPQDLAVLDNLEPK